MVHYNGHPMYKEGTGQDSFTGSHQLPGLVNVSVTIGNHHAIHGKTSTISTGPFSSSQSVKLPEGIFNWRALYWHKSRVTLFSTSTLKFFKCKRPANFAQDKIED